MPALAVDSAQLSAHRALPANGLANDVRVTGVLGDLSEHSARDEPGQTLSVGCPGGTDLDPLRNLVSEVRLLSQAFPRSAVGDPWSP